MTLLTVLMGLALSACGRKGPLEPPPSAIEQAKLVATADTGIMPPVGAKKPETKAAPPPDKPFFLDFLL
jgi:predicted small lipoprotein YifL